MAVSPPPNHLLLFGDQSVEKLSSIKDIVRNSKTIPAARRFLQEATDVVQIEFSRLDRQEHGWDKGFDSLLGMAEDNDGAHDGTNLIVSTVLMCVGRLGQLIVHADQDPTILGSPIEPVEIIALCGGLLPAVVAVAAQDTSQLFILSREIISIAFRLAYEVSRRMKLIEDTPESWGKTYTGLSREAIQDILDRFHESQKIPEFRRIALGVIARDWTTLIGPPSSLRRLEDWSSEIRDAPSFETDISGPIHSNWVPRINAAKVLGSSPLLLQSLDFAKARMISPGSCVEYNHPTLGSLLEEIIEDIAHNPLHVTRLIQRCVSGLDGKRRVKLSVMGATNHLAATIQALGAHGIEYQLSKHEATARIDEMARGGSELVAIVGMAGRFPGSDTVDGFWEGLVAGKCHIKEIPKSRFDLDAFFDPTGEKRNSTTSRHGAWLNDPGLFDHRLFNLSPREAAQMDPGHRLLLTTSYEALQSAGYSPDGSLATTGSRIATYFGQAADEWREILNQRGADIYYVPGFSRAFGPARLNYHYKWGGGSFALDTACSTSATAVALACAALSARECDTALAGGVSVLNSPNTFSGLSKAGMLSATDGCRTYHDDADGYARAEGAGVVVLKRLEDAVEDNDNILAVVRGSARTYSSSATSMTHPCAAAQQETYRRVLRQSGLDPAEVAYVEMHGTGTQAGDVEEMTSVVNALARGRSRNNPLTVGAVKAAVGHGEGASGITSIIKVVMMLRELQIPPQPNWPFKFNPKFPPLATSNVKISTKISTLRASLKGDKRIKMLVNSFDASGGNVSVAIEEAPSRPAKTTDPRAWHVVAISARTAASLQNNHARLLDFLERHPETIIADLAYTTTARRMHESLRCAYVGNTTKSIVRQLRLQTEVPRTRPRARGRIFLFTGQGAQYSGMGGDLFRECRSFRETLFAYQEMATGVGLPDFIDLISGQGRVDDHDDDMSGQSTTKAQLAIVALEIALARLMKIWGVVPDVVIGHSLGEYAALCVSGVLSVSDALLLVGRRAALMETHLAADTYAMLATGAEEQMLLDLFGELELSSCSIACVNAPSVTVASGALHDIDTLQRHMEAQGAKTTLLRVPYGFHSGQVEPVLEGLRRVAEGVVFLKPKIPVVSTVTGRVERDSSVFSPAYLARQAREKVDFVGALRSCEEAGLCGDGSLWLEIGPDPVCLGLVRRTLGIPASHLLPTLRSGENNWRTTSDVLRRIYELGGPVSWSELHKPFIGSVTLLNLPTYAFDLRDFWTTYAEPDLSRQPEGGSQQVTEFSRAPGFPTASLQHVEDEKVEGRTITATFTSRISDPQLLDAIRGHVVNGQPICPLGVFHDMALTAAKYVYYRMHVDSKPSDMSIRNVEISQALVASTKTLDSLICVVASTYHAEDKVVDIQLRSRNGGNMSVHGKCQVTFDDNTSWKSSLSQTLFLLNSRIGALRTQALSGKSHRLLKPVVYRLFSGVVSYSPTYQALEEVIMDPGCTDAIGTVALPDVSRLGTFYANPYWTDAVTHLAGFVLNSGLRYPQDTACLAVGFNTWRSVEDLVPGEVYTTYVCMQEVHGSSHVVSGDCYVFRGGELVQATLGINFLRVKKAALSSILGIPDQIAGRRVVGPNKTLDERTAINDDRNIAAEPKPQSRRGEAPGPLVAAAAERDNGGIDPEEKVWSVLSIVASESGCSPEDMTDDTRYADLGVDSVMAITIFAITGRDLGVDLPASFFLENETIGESRRALLALLGSATDEEIGGANTIGVSGSDGAGAVLPEKPAQPRSLLPGPCLPTPPSSMDSSRPPSPSGSADNTETIKLPPLGTGLEQVVIPSSNLRTTPTAKATHYRGPRTADSIKLFFLPDETGSTFGYIHLAAPSGLAVFGVDSPFAADPAAMAGLDIARLADIYVAAVRREQPVGPYVLGGVSAGAVLAFEVARVLLGGGEEVGGLVIVDCAAPTAVWGGRIRESWNSGGGAGGASVRRRGKPGREEHVERILAVLRDYQPVPLASSQNLKVAIQLLARDEVSSRGREREGAPGWADLIPGLQTREENIETRSFLGVPMINHLGTICKDVVERMKI